MDPAVHGLISPLSALLCTAGSADQVARHEACRQIACGLVSGAAPEDLNLLLRELQAAVVKIRSGVSPSQLLPQRYWESQWQSRSEASAAAASAVAAALSSERQNSAQVVARVEAEKAQLRSRLYEAEMALSSAQLSAVAAADVEKAQSAAKAHKTELESRLKEVETALSIAQRETCEATALCEQHRAECDELRRHLENSTLKMPSDSVLRLGVNSRKATAVNIASVGTANIDESNKWDQLSEVPPPKRRQIAKDSFHEAPGSVPQRRGTMIMAPTQKSGAQLPAPKNPPLKPKTPGMRNANPKSPAAQNGSAEYSNARLLRPGSKIAIGPKASGPKAASSTSLTTNGVEPDSDLQIAWQEFVQGADWDKVSLSLSSKPSDMLVGPLLKLAAESADERTLVIASEVCNMVKTRQVPLSKLVQAMQHVSGMLSLPTDFEASWRSFSLHRQATYPCWHSRQRLFAWVLVHLFPQVAGTTWGWSCTGWTWDTWWMTAKRCLEQAEPRASFGVLIAVAVVVQDISGSCLADLSPDVKRGLREFRQFLLESSGLDDMELDEALAHSSVILEADNNGEDNEYAVTDEQFMALPVEPPDENEIWPASPDEDDNESKDA